MDIIKMLFAHPSTDLKRVDLMLSYAINDGDTELVELLHARGANFRGDYGSDGDTPLSLALVQGVPDMVRVLLHGPMPDPSMRDLVSDNYWMLHVDPDGDTDCKFSSEDACQAEIIELLVAPEVVARECTTDAAMDAFIHNVRIAKARAVERGWDDVKVLSR
ncbi:hypothetical protein FOA52_013239 [Chlamydomonas sp. UWO 241]|nr:hypothetical protein FOA52_013239 [Chlamydomonas sp. UWO 241]